MMILGQLATAPSFLAQTRDKSFPQQKKNRDK